MTLLLERGDIPGFKVGRRRRRHEKRGGAWVRGHRVSGLVQRESERSARLFAQVRSTAGLAGTFTRALPFGSAHRMTTVNLGQHEFL